MSFNCQAINEKYTVSARTCFLFVCLFVVVVVVCVCVVVVAVAFFWEGGGGGGLQTCIITPKQE